MTTATFTTPASTAAATATRFSRPRFALLVLIGVYPIVTGLLYAVLPLTRGWAIWQTTMVIVPIMVVTMVWGLIPTLQTRFRGFLNPQG